MPQSRIVQFFEGTGRDGSGRLLADVLKFDDARLEQVHDYIQWLFPLPEPSGANPLAPTLSGEDVAAFLARPDLRAVLREGFLRMLAFYGFAYDGGAIAPGAFFWKRKTVWLSSWNHNHLRLTRILRSTRLLGLEDESRALFQCLTTVYESAEHRGHDHISPETYRYWQAAAQGLALP